MTKDILKKMTPKCLTALTSLMTALVTLAGVLTLFSPSAGLALSTDGVVNPQVRSRGGYEVPTENEELKEYAKFDFADIKVTQKNGRTRVSYTLPAELLGQPQKVRFEGFQGLQGVLVSENGEMKCENVAELTNCAVSYRNLKLDADAREEHLRSISSSSEELSKRLLLAMSFDRDPHGILSFETREVGEFGKHGRNLQSQCVR